MSASKKNKQNRQKKILQYRNNGQKSAVEVGQKKMSLGEALTAKSKEIENVHTEIWQRHGHSAINIISENIPAGDRTFHFGLTLRPESHGISKVRARNQEEMLLRSQSWQSEESKIIYHPFIPAAYRKQK